MRVCKACSRTSTRTTTFAIDRVQLCKSTLFEILINEAEEGIIGGSRQTREINLKELKIRKGQKPLRIRGYTR